LLRVAGARKPQWLGLVDTARGGVAVILVVVAIDVVRELLVAQHGLATHKGLGRLVLVLERIHKVGVDGRRLIFEPLFASMVDDMSREIRSEPDRSIASMQQICMYLASLLCLLLVLLEWRLLLLLLGTERIELATDDLYSSTIDDDRISNHPTSCRVQRAAAREFVVHARTLEDDGANDEASKPQGIVGAASSSPSTGLSLSPRGPDMAGVRSSGGECACEDEQANERMNE